jgi:hypothetical protein
MARRDLRRHRWRLLRTARRGVLAAGVESAAGEQLEPLGLAGRPSRGAATDRNCAGQTFSMFSFNRLPILILFSVKYPLA